MATVRTVDFKKKPQAGRTYTRYDSVEGKLGIHIVSVGERVSKEVLNKFSDGFEESTVYQVEVEYEYLSGYEHDYKGAEVGAVIITDNERFIGEVVSSHKYHAEINWEVA